MQAVAWVILNRGAAWNMTVCDVVHHKLGNRCQFVWHCDSKSDVLPKLKNAEKAHRLATDMILNPNKYTDPTYGALFFHATYVHPKWKSKRKLTRKIGKHLFYR